MNHQPELDLVWENLWLVDMVAEQLGLDIDEVSDLGFITLQRVNCSYDPSRGSFTWFARKALLNAMTTYLRTKINMREIHENDIRQKDTFDVCNTEEFSKIRSRLSGEEYDVLCAYFIHGESMQSIADREGVIRQSIWVRINKALERCRDEETNSKN